MLQIHERLGDFEILRLLGRGGMGEVYEARQANPERPVALKVLAPWLADDDESLKRFLREAQVLANLDHPGIVRIISTGKTESGIAYYAMHLVRGISLTDMIQRAASEPRDLQPPRTPSMSALTVDATPSEKAPPPRPSPAPCSEMDPPLLGEYRRNRFTAVARIGAQAARALAYAHSEGYLHRDIKASNLMVDQHGHVYLVDFGLTRGLQPAADGTQPGVLVGTPWYMSPEQADGKAIDNRSDIYSLGVTLFELTTQGIGPFTASRDNKESVLEQVRAGQLLPLRTLAPGIPPGLECAILKAMNLKPHRRYASADMLARDLESLIGLQTNPVAAPPATMRRPPRPWRFWIGGALVALLLAITAWVVNAVRVRDPNDNKGPYQVADAKFDGTKALPNLLRSHPLNVPISLLSDNFEPLWHERFHGQGKYSPYPDRNKLELMSVRNSDVTIFGLADPDRHCFRFSIQLAKIYYAPPDEELAQLGVVFGWRRQAADSSLHPRFFVVELAGLKKAPKGHGFLKIGTGRLVQPTGNRGTIGNDWLRLLPENKGLIPLQKTGGFHTITVDVRKDSAAVSVDDLPPRRFSIPWLRECDEVAARDLNTRGAVGIWSVDGVGLFRNAMITLLPDE